MQIEQLQNAWQGLDRKLDRALAVQAELVRDAVVRAARGRLNRLSIWPAIDVAVSIGVLALCATFIGEHSRQWPVVLPAAVAAAGAVVLLATSIQQLSIVRRVDWTAPIAEIQASLAKLRMARIRQFQWIMLLAPLLGFCVFIAGLHWILEHLTDDKVNVLDRFSPWIVWNYAFGVLFVPLAYLVARVLAKRCEHRAWWQALLDDISGKSLKAATNGVQR